MKKQHNTIVIVLILLTITVSSLLNLGNKFMALKEDVKMQESQISVTLQRRCDLIPNLVGVVDEYVKHEEKIFFEIAEARQDLVRSLNTKDISSIESASIAFDSALSKLIAISENYPDLKSSEQFIALMDELAGTENRIAIARQSYNESVNKYNKAVLKFPTSVAAYLLGYHVLPYFQASVDINTSPILNFS